MDNPGASHDFGNPPTQRLNPFLCLTFFGWRRKWLDVTAGLVLLVVVIGTRWAAFPASIWEQDEAYFGSGVVRFDPAENSPHPPWFPLWMALGKATHPLGERPTDGLQIVSAVSSVLVLFPLVSLWSRWLRRDLAVAAALLYLFNPAAWVLSGRAFTEPLAVYFLVTTLAYWFAREASVFRLSVGSACAGLCLLTRAHYLLPLVVVGLSVAHRISGGARRLALVVPATALVVGGYGLVLIQAGGMAPAMEALQRHSAYHFGELAGAELSFTESGIARAFLTPWAALSWIAAALVGLFVVWIHRRKYTTFPAMIFAAGLPLLMLVYGLSWPGHVRYVLPLVALGSGCLVVGLKHLVGRWSLPVIALALAAQILPIVPELRTYREVASPPVRALEHGLAEARRSGAVIVTDSTLASFFDYERRFRGIPGTVLHDSQIGVDTPAPPPWFTVAVFDHGHGSFVASSRESATFRCEQRWLRRLSQDRFLDVTVAVGAEVRPFSGRPSPSKKGRRGEGS